MIRGLKNGWTFIYFPIVNLLTSHYGNLSDAIWLMDIIISSYNDLGYTYGNLPFCSRSLEYCIAFLIFPIYNVRRHLYKIYTRLLIFTML